MSLVRSVSQIVSSEVIRRFTFSILTPWSRVIEKLIGSQLLKKFPAFCGTRRFTTALASFHHLFLSWARYSRSMPPHPTSGRSISILSSHLRLGLRPHSLLKFYRACTNRERELWRLDCVRLVSDICGSFLWISLHAIVLARRICRWLLTFGKFVYPWFNLLFFH